MLYTLGFMKCVIAPTFGMALWAWLHHLSATTSAGNW